MKIRLGGKQSLFIVFAAVAAAGLIAASGDRGLHAAASGARGGIGSGTGSDLVNIYCAGFLESGLLGMCISVNIASPPRPGNFDPNGR